MGKQRYVVASRRAGRFEAAAKLAARANVGLALQDLGSPQILRDTNPSDQLARRVTIIEADPAEIAAKIATMPANVIVEPEILHWRDIVLPRDLLPVRRGFEAAPLDAAPGNAVTLTVTGGGTPLAHAAVELHSTLLGANVRHKGRTDAAGICSFQIPMNAQPSVAVVAPIGGFWTMLARGLDLTRTIECPPLPTDGPLGWWHEMLGLDTFDTRLGESIRVGVADTGVGPHANLAHAIGIGAFIDGERLPPERVVDVDAHGTHVAATIGARPVQPSDYAGIAPGCELFAARIFKGPDDGATNADIANAIDALSREHQVDIINLSLGTTDASEVVHDAIIDALERGTLCICAAGNDAAAVNFPAAFPESVAVAAAGLQGWGPAGSLSAARLPLDPILFGTRNMFAANFTSKGAAIDCVGPGVGILAAVPNPISASVLHGGMDGTSMASPAVCGALAARLSQDPSYRALPRDLSRAQAARRLLIEMLQEIGLPLIFEGRGMPLLPPRVGS